MSSPTTENIIECPICGEVSEQPYLNYGAKACYSCRAFFRRAHQKTKNPDFTCKGITPKTVFNEECEITVKTRRQCQKCRYEKCLRAGMKPEFVMSEEQKKARFKSDLEFGPAGEILPHDIPPKVCVPKRKYNRRKNLKQVSINHRSYGRFNQHNHGQNSLALNSDSDEPWRASSNDEHSDLFEDINALQCNVSSDDLYELGLLRNLLNTEPPYQNDCSDPFFMDSSFTNYNKDSNSIYASDSLVVSDLIFSPDQNIIESSSPSVLEYLEEAPGSNKVVEEKFSSLDQNSYEGKLYSNELEEIIAAVEDKNIDSNDEEAHNAEIGLDNQIPEGIDHVFKDLEDFWVSDQLAKFRSVYLDVSMGEEFLREFVMFTYDVPLSKHFVPQVTTTNAERYQRALTIFDEFNSLSPAEKQQLMTENIYKAVALGTARICNCLTGKCQLKHIIGYMDNQIFEETFANLVDVNKLKKIQMKEINSQTNLLVPEVLKQYVLLVDNLRFIVRDREIHELFMFVVLFSGHMKDKSTQVSMMHRRYLQIMRRRLYRRNPDTCDVELGRINGSITKVNNLADILRTLHF